MSREASTQNPAGEAALRLVCTEVWGGNRAINAPIELPGLRGRIYSRACQGGRGGDVHYLSVCGSGLLARLCIADVAGHGDAVASVSAALHRMLRRHMNALDQRRVLANLNRNLTQDLGLDALTTAAAATYYPPSRSLSVSYAGHPPGWLYDSREERWVRLARQSQRGGSRGIFDLPLAADRDTRFSRRDVKVNLGDRLLLVTDGLLEAPSPTRELLGPDRVQQVLDDHRGDEPDAIIQALLRTAEVHGGGGELAHDDVTLLLVEFTPGPPGPAVWTAIRNRILRPRGNSQSPQFQPAGGGLARPA